MQRMRFQDATWYDQTRNYNIIIGGAGGIGSWLSFLLIRAGFSIVVYDDDIVEEHNLGGQLFQVSDIGKPKVEALSRVINTFNFPTGSVFYRNEKITENTRFNIGRYHSAIFVSCFDNMEARKTLFNKYIEHCNINSYSAFVDGRLLMEQMTIFNVNKFVPNSQEMYVSEYLFDDSEVEDLPCSMKQTTHSAAMIASHMVGFITNYVSNEKYRENMFATPFKWDYLIPLNLQS